VRADRELMIVNGRFCEILGRTEEELRHCRFADFTHPDDLALNERLFDRAKAAGSGFHMEKRYVRPDGTSVWCEVSVSFVRDAEGVVQSWIVVAQDISSRKAAEGALAEQSSLLQNVVDSVADLIFVKDLSGRFILANRALTDGCGDLIGGRTPDYFDDDLTPTYENVDRDVVESGQMRMVDEVIPIHGHRRTFETVKVPWIRDGQTLGVIGVSRDVTEQKAAEQALRQSELLYRSVLEASADCIKIIDPDGRIRLMNSPGQRAMDLESFEEVRGRKWADLWPREARPILRAALAEAMRGQVARFTGCCPTWNRTRKWWDVVLTPMCDENGCVTNVLAISRDVTAQRETDEQLRWASEHDELTGLPNRRAFQNRLQAATLRAMETSGSIGLLLIDLDHFKHVNDSLGHSAGDYLLKHFGRRLRESVRAGDFIARLGGDEFAVILEGKATGPDLALIGDSVLERLRKPIRYNGRIIRTGASIGGAMFPSDAESAHELFNNADTALYSLKSAGRGGTKMFHPLMREEAKRAASQLSLARTGISERSVEPHYQQKVDLSTGETIGFEALLRWRHPSFGIQLPGSVSEAFEDYELSTKIGELVQRRVFADIRDWSRCQLPFGTIAINASPAEFLRDDYAERLIERIAEFSVDPASVEIEVTEHALLDRGGRYVARALEVLSSVGVRIALDDFGTGYSSLSHLRDFPVDVLKIDQSFIRTMVQDAEIESIVAAVIGLSRSLDIDVVAEGIETVEQRERLLSYGCLFGQGHWFGRPIDRSGVERLFTNSSPKRASGRDASHPPRDLRRAAA
jgi:diguanylate cyclase (GGDEF)-like protein/PAS domain S-box-containing protein